MLYSRSFKSLTALICLIAGEGRIALEVGGGRRWVIAGEGGGKKLTLWFEKATIGGGGVEKSLTCEYSNRSIWLLQMKTPLNRTCLSFFE